MDSVLKVAMRLLLLAGDQGDFDACVDSSLAALAHYADARVDVLLVGLLVVDLDFDWLRLLEFVLHLEYLELMRLAGVAHGLRSLV